MTKKQAIAQFRKDLDGILPCILSDSDFRQIVDAAEACAQETRGVEYAIQQFTGYKEALNGPDITHLVEAMGLTKDEWKIVRPDVKWLGHRLIAEINEHFKERK